MNNTTIDDSQPVPFTGFDDQQNQLVEELSTWLAGQENQRVIKGLEITFGFDEVLRQLGNGEEIEIRLLPIDDELDQFFTLRRSSGPTPGGRAATCTVCYWFRPPKCCWTFRKVTTSELA